MTYDSKFKRDDIDELFKAILLLEDEEDCYRFFEDICTINEIHAIAQRLQVAKLLSEHKTYNDQDTIQDQHCQRDDPGIDFVLCRIRDRTLENADMPLGIDPVV